MIYKKYMLLTLFEQVTQMKVASKNITNILRAVFTTL